MWVSAMRPCLAAVLVAVTVSHLLGGTHAHAPGEEFTYLNMFRKHEETRGAVDTNSFVNQPTVSVKKVKTKHRRILSSREKARPAVIEEPRESSNDEDPPVRTRPSRRSRNILSSSKKRDDTNESEGGEASEESEDSSKNDSGKEDGDEKTPASKPAPFEGVGSERDGEDIKRVSFMLMRLLKQYKAQSMVDVPCRAHSSWMHKFLQRAETEIPGFKYFCVDTNKDILHALKARVKGSTDKLNSRFVLRQFWTELLPRADVVFSWSGLEKMKKTNVLGFLKNVATSQRHKYIILGNHMKGSKLPKRDGKPALKPMNVRSDPFHLVQPMRVVSKLSVGPVKKQMYLYKTEEMHEDWTADS